jgi:hypothetical protein
MNPDGNTHLQREQESGDFGSPLAEPYHKFREEGRLRQAENDLQRQQEAGDFGAPIEEPDHAFREEGRARQAEIDAAWQNRTASGMTNPAE